MLCSAILAGLVEEAKELAGLRSWQPSGKKVQCIGGDDYYVIGRVNAKGFLSNLAQFVEAVREFKERAVSWMHLSKQSTRC